MGMANDAAQGFPTTRVGDMLLQQSTLVSVGTGPNANLVQVYPTVWYPSASSPAVATRLTIGAGRNFTGINLPEDARGRRACRASSPVRTGQFVSLDASGARQSRGSRRRCTSSLSLSFTTAMTVSDATGAFTFMAVPPGRYVIRAGDHAAPARGGAAAHFHRAQNRRRDDIERVERPGTAADARAGSGAVGGDAGFCRGPGCHGRQRRAPNGRARHRARRVRRDLTETRAAGAAHGACLDATGRRPHGRPAERLSGANQSDRRVLRDRPGAGRICTSFASRAHRAGGH